LIFILISLSIILYTLFISSIFSIKTIQFSGERYVDKSSVFSYFKKVRGENLLLYNLNTSAFLQKFPIIEGVDVQKILPSSVFIKITEVPPKVQMQTSRATYIYSQKGILLDTLLNTSTKYSLPLVVTNEHSMHQVDYSILTLFIVALENDKNGFIKTFLLESPFTLVANYSDNHSITLSLNKSLPEQLQSIRQIKQYIGFKDCHDLDTRFSSLYCKKL